MSSVLEQRYRQLLRLLPAGYRAQWEEDMVATFLEASYEAYADDPELMETARPTRAEALSVLGLAVRLRVGGVEAPPRPRLFGDALRLVALILMLVMAGIQLSQFSLITTGNYSLRLQFGPDASVTHVMVMQICRYLVLLWVAAFMSLLYGRFRTAKAFAVCGLVGTLTPWIYDAVAGGVPIPRAELVRFAVPVVAVVALLAYRPTAPRPRLGPWLLALVVCAAVQSAVLLVAVHAMQSDDYVLLDPTGIWCAAYVVAALALGARVRPGDEGPAQWALALALLAPLLLALRGIGLLDTLNLPADLRLPFQVVYAVELGVVLVAGVHITSRCRQAWRALPVSYPAAAAAEEEPPG
jgi:hypothetical protein